MIYTICYLERKVDSYFAIDRADDTVVLGRSRCLLKGFAFCADAYPRRISMIRSPSRYGLIQQPLSTPSVAPLQTDLLRSTPAPETNEQSTLTYVGKIMEAHDDKGDSRGTRRLGPTATVGELIRAST